MAAMGKTINPADLSFFSVLVHCGSLTAAARELGLTTPAVSKRLSQIEARLGTTLVDDSIFGSDIKIDNFAGVYAKGILPVSDVASIYGLLGYTQGKLTAENALGSGSDSDSDISYGIGADFAISATTSVGVEWARLFKGEGFKVDGLSVGVSFKF